MYIIIAGGGMIGKGLTQRLVESKHDVVVIDNDSTACEEIYSKFGAVTIHGNATDLDVMESAKIDRADAVVAVMTKDSDNLAFALLAKHFNVKQIIVRMMDPKYEGIYKTVGVHNIARTTSIMIDQLLVSIESPELRKVIDFGNLEICIINVPDNSKFIGKNVKQLTSEKGFPEDIIICCIYEDQSNAFYVPHGKTLITPKDRLFICGKRNDIKKVYKIIKSKK